MTSLVLMAAYYRLRWYASTYGLLLVLISSAAVVFMALLWPAFRYHHTASANAATWDVDVNGPLTDRDIRTILRVAGPNTSWAAASRGGVNARVARTGRSLVVDSYEISHADSGRFEMTWAPPGIVLAGDLDSSQSAGVDWVTAKTAGLRIGDRIIYRETYSDSQGLDHTVTGSARVTAVLATTAEFRGFILPSTEANERMLRAAVDVAASDVFIRTEQPERVAAKLNALPAASNWNVGTRSEFRRDAMARAEGSGAHSYGERGVLVAAAVLLALILRDLLMRVSRRRKSLAILYSLGSRPRPLVVAHILEQVALLSVILVGGYLAGPRLLVTVTGLYPPASTLAQISALWLGGSLLLTAICAAHVLWSMRERSLVLLASSEGE